ncbi:MAG: SPFH/Band 7/PHB domain protein [Bacteroidetes bacterium]|jgi:regulator of protease activity HflC (stomatin/prohibitin superfamily)|nr:SPFH/Band 7/PHB domain protein [Bacteroidota bacterium]
MSGATLIVGLLAIFIVIFAVSGFKIIQQSETMIIERLGRYHKTLSSGINVILPIIDKPREMNWRYVVQGLDGRKYARFKTRTRIDLRETVYDFPKQNVITKDNVGVEINAIIYFQVMDPVKALYEINNLPDAIEKLTQTTLRNVIGELELDESLVSRDTINTKLRMILDEASNKWGVKVNRVEIQDINPPADIRNAMEKQMRAERDRRAAILEAEGMKQAKILEAQGFKESEINRAEGERQAKILDAEGKAQAIITVAQAEKEAIMQIAEAVANQKGDPVNYLIAMKYIDALKVIAEGQDNKVVYMPYEATGILSSIGGIKDLFKHA